MAKPGGMDSFWGRYSGIEKKLMGMAPGTYEADLKELKLLRFTDIDKFLRGGMHISSCVSLTTDNIKKRGSRHFLEWSRTKTRCGVPAQIPKDYLDGITAYLSHPRRLTRQQHNNILKEIGERAGYDELAPMTFRHTLCVKLICAGWAVPEITQKLGVLPGGGDSELLHPEGGSTVGERGGGVISPSFILPNG